MSIILQQKINILYDFFFNIIDKKCFNIDNIDIKSIIDDDYKIVQPQLCDNIIDQLLLDSTLQYFYSDDKNIIFKRFNYKSNLLVKISAESTKIQDNDSKISYILSELVIKSKTKHILLSILNLQLNIDKLKPFINIKSNSFFDESNKLYGLKIQEHFHTISTLENFLKKKYSNLTIKIVLWQIIHTLYVISEQFPTFVHNNLNTDNILVYEKNTYDNDYEYHYNNTVNIVALNNFDIKITNFENSTLKSEKNILNDLDFISNNILNLKLDLDLDTKNFLIKIIELIKMKNSKILNIMNDKYFSDLSENNSRPKKKQSSLDEINETDNMTGIRMIKSIKSNKSNRSSNSSNSRIIKTEYYVNLKNEGILGNQKIIHGGFFDPRFKKEPNTPYKTNDELEVSKKNYVETKEQEVKVEQKIYDVSNEKNKKTWQYTPRKEQNTPYMTIDEMEINRKKQLENKKRDPPLLLEQKLYDVNHEKNRPPPLPPPVIPLYDINNNNYMEHLYNQQENPYYKQSPQKIYNISLANPMGNYTTISKVFEDIIPGDPRLLGYNTIYERTQLIKWLRNVIIQQYDGEVMTEQSLLLSHIKLNQVNPFSLGGDPYKDLPTNFLIYNSAYPIRLNELHNLTIAKNSVGINVRLYNLTYGEERANNINKNINKLKFNLWRELKYYEYVKSDILNTKLSQNFITSILYKLDMKSDYKWKELQNSQSFQSYQNKQTNSHLNKLHNEHENSKNIQKLDQGKKHPVHIFINNVDSLDDKFYNDLLIESSTNKNLILTANNNSLNSVPSINIKYMDLTDEKIKIEKYLGNHEINNFKDWINNIAYEENKKDINLTSNKTLILLTESPNTTLIKWMTAIYDNNGSKQIMVSSGYHPYEVYKSVIFQMIYIFAVLQNNQIDFEELSLEKNFYIKDLNIDKNIQNYWIYNIDSIDYYVPNYGYLVLFDSKYSDISIKDRKYKINSPNIFENENDNIDFNNEINAKFIKFFDPIEFANQIKKLTKTNLDDSVKNFLSIIKDNFYKYNRIHNIFMDLFSDYLHNRIYTRLLKNERELVSEFCRPVLKKGSLIIYRVNHNDYRWVLYDSQGTGAPGPVGAALGGPGPAAVIQNNILQQIPILLINVILHCEDGVATPDCFDDIIIHLHDIINTSSVIQIPILANQLNNILNAGGGVQRVNLINIFTRLTNLPPLGVKRIALLAAIKALEIIIQKGDQLLDPLNRNLAQNITGALTGPTLFRENVRPIDPLQNLLIASLLEIKIPANDYHQNISAIEQLLGRIPNNPVYIPQQQQQLRHCKIYKKDDNNKIISENVQEGNLFGYPSDEILLPNQITLNQINDSFIFTPN